MNVLRPVAIYIIQLLLFAASTAGCGGSAAGGGTVSGTAVHSLSGTIRGAIAGGVTITISGPAEFSTRTCGLGYYAFRRLASGSYTIVPTLAGYTFSPASLTVTVNDADITGADFDSFPETPPVHALSGTMSGAVVQGVTIALSGAANRTVTTDADGNFGFTGLADGNYTLTPALAGYRFDPASMPVSINGSDVSERNFIAAAIAAPTYRISGSVTGVASSGVTIILSGATNTTHTTDANGNYNFVGLANGTYTLTPSLAGHIFNPASTAVTINNANATGRNFTAMADSAPTYVISGTMSGAVVQGVTLTLDGAMNATSMTDAAGNYSFPGLLSGDYTVTPSCAGYRFVSAETAVTLVNANAPGVNFAAMPHAGNSYGISGTVSGVVRQGVTIRLLGTSCATTMTDAGGNYSFTGLAAGDYEVTPVTWLACSYISNPVFTRMTITGSDAAGVDFSLTAGSNCSSAGSAVNMHSISGSVSGVVRQGVTMILTGPACGVVTTDVNGYYSFYDFFTAGTYSITPAMAGRAFNPTTITVPFTSSDVTGRNFTSI